jgi:hypothetical protein
VIVSPCDVQATWNAHDAAESRVVVRGQTRGLYHSGRHDYVDADFSKTVVKEGSPTLTIRVTGFNFFQRSQMYFNDVPVPTKVLNRTQIEATIDESLLRSPGRFPIVVKNLTLADPANPALGSGTSNRAWLVVGYR